MQLPTPADAGSTMVQLFEDHPATESLLLWYPMFIVAAELTLPLIHSDVEDRRQPEVVWVSTAFFTTLVTLENWHFMILYALCSTVP